MKSVAKLSTLLLFTVAISISACDNDSNEATGDEIETQDSSILNNYNNTYPDNRIHMKDSNSAEADTTLGRDTLRR